MQTCTDHLELRAGGTTGVTSLTSRPSQELAEVLSMGLSGNPMQTSPEHLHCIDDQQSGSWNISVFDEAAAQIQGTSDNRITSALNDVRAPSLLHLLKSSVEDENAPLRCYVHQPVFEENTQTHCLCAGF